MKIAILGTGAMGTAMGEAIIKAGHELIAYNRTANRTAELAKAGAKVVATAREAIDQSDISIFVMIDSEAVKNTLLNQDVLEVVDNKKIINASSSTLEDVIEIAEAIIKRGGKFAEISMQADPEALRSTTGTFEIGCSKEDEPFWVDILSTFSGDVKRVGEIGDATKIASISLVGMTLSLVKIAYSVAIAQRLGVKQEVYEPIINMMDPLAAWYMPNMITHNYDEGVGNVEGSMKISNMAINIAKSNGIATELLNDVLKLFEKAAENGYAKKDGSAILEVLLNFDK